MQAEVVTAIVLQRALLTTTRIEPGLPVSSAISFPIRIRGQKRLSGFHRTSVARACISFLMLFLHRSIVSSADCSGGAFLLNNQPRLMLISPSRTALSSSGAAVVLSCWTLLTFPTDARALGAIRDCTSTLSASVNVDEPLLRPPLFWLASACAFEGEFVRVLAARCDWFGRFRFLWLCYNRATTCWLSHCAQVGASHKRFVHSLPGFPASSGSGSAW